MKNFEDDLKPVQLYKSLYPKKVLANKKWFKSNLNEIKKEENGSADQKGKNV